MDRDWNLTGKARGSMHKSKALAVVGILVGVLGIAWLLLGRTTYASEQDWRAVLEGLPQEDFSPPPLLVCPDVNHCWVSAWVSQRATVSTPVVAKSTSDGGNTWIPWEIPGLPVITSAAFLDTTFGYAGAVPDTSNGRHYNSQGLARTRDGGRSWQIVSGMAVDSLHVVNRMVAYVGTVDPYKTTDGGDTWHRWFPGSVPPSTQFLDENIAWSIVDFSYSSDYHLQFTTDGGQSWTTVFPEDDPNARYGAFFFLNYREGWVGRAGTLLHTTDAGQTWERLTSPLNEGPHMLVFLSPQLGWIEGGGRVYRTKDGGRTWQLDYASSFFTLSAGNDFDHGWGVTATQVWKRAPGLALTPIATATPVPGTTPTATRTPFAPPVPTGTVLPSPTPTPVVISPERSRLVRQAYLSALGREPDPGGLAYWAGTGLDWPELLRALEASDEGLRVTAVRGIYIELLGRDPLGPDNAGLRSWVESGLSLEEIRQGLIDSAEYRLRHPDAMP